MVKQGRQRFATSEVWAERVSLRRADLLRARAIAAAISTTSGAVLDVGCGDGSVLEQLWELEPDRDLFGVDLHVAALQAVRRSTGRRVSLGVADAAAMPFRSGTFSAVICAEVLEHLPAGVFEDAVVELARVPRELVVISVPNSERLRRRHLRCPACEGLFHAYGHLRSFTREDMADLVPGFSLESLQEIGPRRNEGFAALDGLWRRDRLTGALLVCPGCGWQGSGRDAGVAAGNVLARSTTRLLAKASDRFGRPRWLLAVYRRRRH